MRVDYLFRKIHFRKVLLFLWTHNVSLLHYSYFIANHFIQLVTHVESLALFCNLWPQVTLRTRPCYCHQVTRLFNSKYEIWIPVFNKTVPKWLYLKYFFGFWAKRSRQSRKTRLVYHLLMLGKPRTQWKKLSSKFYLSRWTIAFGSPLIRGQNVLVLDGQTSGSSLLRHVHHVLNYTIR